MFDKASDKIKEQTVTPDWLEAEKITGILDVHEALKNFSEDATQDNATCVVLAITKVVIGEWLQGIKDDGYRTDNERYAAQILLRIAPKNRA